MSGTTTDWIIFAVVVAVALALDLFVVHRKGSEVTLKRALAETCCWIGLALSFGAWIYVCRSRQHGVEFLTAYLLEKSLSADNIFVFLLIFRALGIDSRYQHRVLYTGIFGALVMRLAFISLGIELLRHFHFALYAFGAALMLLGMQMLFFRRVVRFEENWLLRLVRKIHPVDASYQGEKFWIHLDGRRIFTPLLLALVAIEVTDIIFALDSVPAVLAITRDPFIAYSSNVFAILGLRAIYFGVAQMMKRMRFLHQGLAAILLFVGAKMLLSEQVPISTTVSLAVILGTLALAALASWLLPGADRFDL
ncbi:MAG TPA: TerC/Alx family metal homeostasis membrane protein [Terriglobales bacterium]|nr:TerC/Alx family metal homeostasis membrane protein [Terriglobales bacterium]